MAKKKRGRKPFKKTAALQRQVELLVLAGKSQDSIARVIGCTTPTLKKHFSEELEFGATKKLLDVLLKMDKSASKGNVSAQRKLYDIGIAAQLAAAGGQSAKPGAKPGKKDLEKAAAATAGGEGTEWGSDLAPNVVAFKKPS